VTAAAANLFCRDISTNRFRACDIRTIDCTNTIDLSSDGADIIK
jgi:hypothetical protein